MLINNLGIEFWSSTLKLSRNGLVSIYSTVYVQYFRPSHFLRHSIMFLHMGTVEWAYISGLFTCWESPGIVKRCCHHSEGSLYWLTSLNISVAACLAPDRVFIRNAGHDDAFILKPENQSQSLRCSQFKGHMK